MSERRHRPVGFSWDIRSKFCFWFCLISQLRRYTIVQHCDTVCVRKSLWKAPQKFLGKNSPIKSFCTFYYYAFGQIILQYSVGKEPFRKNTRFCLSKSRKYRKNFGSRRIRSGVSFCRFLFENSSNSILVIRLSVKEPVFRIRRVAKRSKRETFIEAGKGLAFRRA